MEAPITITQHKLLSLSPEVHLQVQEVTTTKQIPTKGKLLTKAFIVEEEDENDKIPSALAFAYQHALHRTPPEGSTIILDPIEAYYKSLKYQQEPDLDCLTVAKGSIAICVCSGG